MQQPVSTGRKTTRNARRAVFLGLWVGVILARRAAAGTIPQPWTNLFAPLPEAQQALVDWRWEEALSLFQQAAEGQEPAKARWGRLGAGLCWQALGQPEKALPLWEELTGEADLVAAHAHYLLAQVALEVGEAEAAWEHLGAAVKIAPIPDRLVPLLRGLGAGGFDLPEEQREADARTAYGWLLTETDLLIPFPTSGIEEATESLAGQSWVVRCVGWAALGQGLEGQNREAAEEAYRRAVEAAKEAGEVCLIAEEGLGRPALQAGAGEEAIRHLAIYVREGAKVLWPVSVDPRFRLAERLYEGKKWAEAVEEYRAVLRRMGPEHPKYVATLLHHGLAAKALEVWEEAGKALKEAAQASLDPQTAVFAALRYAEVEEAAGRTDEAIKFLQDMVQQGNWTGQQEGLLTVKAAYLCNTPGRWDEGIRLCREFIEAHPEEREQCASAWLRMAYCYEHSGRPAEAEAAFQRVIEGYPEFPRLVAIAKADLAFAVLARRGKIREAIALTEEALQGLTAEQPEYVTLKFRTGVFTMQLGRYEEALRIFNEVPEGRPGSDPTWNVAENLVDWKVECLLRLGREEEAEQLFARAVAQSKAKEGKITQWEKMLEMRQRWREQPIQATVSRLHLDLPPGLDVRQEWVVCTRERIPLEVKSSLPFLRVRVSEPSQDDSPGFSSEVVYHRVIVEVNPEVANGVYPGFLRITSPVIPGYQLEIPVKVGWIRVHPTVAFLGFAKPGEVKEVVVTLSNIRSFQVKEAEADVPGISIKFTPNEEHTDHRLKIQWTPLNGNKFVEGSLRVVTDVRGGETIVIPCYGWVQERE